MGKQGYGKFSKSMPGYDSVDRRQVAKVPRNGPCPCGSGRKYKDCHESEGSAFLMKLAKQKEQQRLKEQGVPWYRRLFMGG
jgi:hypothetical protein